MAGLPGVPGHGPDPQYHDVVQQLHKSRALVGRWSSRWQWVARVDAYDAYLDHERQAETLKAVREMHERYIRVAQTLLSKTAHRLVGNPADGTPGLDPQKMSAADVCRTAETASKIESFHRGVDRPGSQDDNAAPTAPENTLTGRLLANPKAMEYHLRALDELAVYTPDESDHSA